MATAYRKTAKGLAEVETRVYRLPPRTRGLLILLDGKRTLEELRPLVSQGLEDGLRVLLDGGFTEGVAVADRAPRAAPATAARGAEATPAAPAEPDADFLAVRREVVRFINEHLGPEAETLAITMERTRSAAELLPLLPAAAHVIHNVRGAQAANAFRARFIAG